MKYDPDKVLDRFAIHAESYGDRLFALHFVCSEFEFLHVQKIRPNGYEQGWLISNASGSETVTPYVSFEELHLPSWAMRYLSINPLESELWAHDVRCAVDPLVKQATAAVREDFALAPARWASFTLKLQLAPTSKA